MTAPFAVVPLPALPVPEDKQIFVDTSIDSWFTPAAVSGSKSTAVASKSGFHFGKALSGIQSEKGSAVTSKGDGSFADGSQVMQKGNRVYLGPNALTGDNAEETLKKLDRLQKGGTAAPKPAEKHKAKPLPPASQFRGVAESAASNTLYDLDDGNDDMSPSGSGATKADGGSGRTKASTWSFTQPEAPHHVLTEVPGEGGSPGRLEVLVSMPRCCSAEDVSVDVGTKTLKISAPGVYRLVVDLPCAVDDGSVKCKWSSKKSQMTVVLSKK